MSEYKLVLAPFDREGCCYLVKLSNGELVRLTQEVLDSEEDLIPLDLLLQNGKGDIVLSTDDTSNRLMPQWLMDAYVENPELVIEEFNEADYNKLIAQTKGTIDFNSEAYAPVNEFISRTGGCFKISGVTDITILIPLALSTGEFYSILEKDWDTVVFLLKTDVQTFRQQFKEYRVSVLFEKPSIIAASYIEFIAPPTSAAIEYLTEPSQEFLDMYYKQN